MVEPVARDRVTILGQTILPIGFGCARLRDRRGRKQAETALAAALDHGITYFDLARLYGMGEAERVVGRALKPVRSRCVIATKAGILPADRSFAKRLYAAGQRRATRFFPALGQLLPKAAGLEPRFNQFEISTLRDSVETSLRELGSDYIDILLLHECTAEQARDPAILGLMDDLKREGKIRTYGAAPTIEETNRIVAHGETPPVLQFKDSVWEPADAALVHATSSLKIVHSCLGPDFIQLVARLDAMRSEADRFWNSLGLSPGDNDGLARHVLAYSLTRNPAGLVLFSSSRPERIRRYVESGGITTEMAQNAAARIRELGATPGG